MQRTSRRMATHDRLRVDALLTASPFALYQLDRFPGRRLAGMNRSVSGVCQYREVRVARVVPMSRSQATQGLLSALATAAAAGGQLPPRARGRSPLLEDYEWGTEARASAEAFDPR